MEPTLGQQKSSKFLGLVVHRTYIEVLINAFFWDVIAPSSILLSNLFIYQDLEMEFLDVMDMYFHNLRVFRRRLQEELDWVKGKLHEFIQAS